ncbi:LPS-assembly protein LptD, partial [Candidatus Omnitrophota bacterium]
VEYLHDKKKVVASNNVVIIYKDVKLTCRKVTVYLDTREAIAEGNVRITQKGAVLTGDKINYNFDTKKGTWIKGAVMAEPWYGRSKEIEKVSDKEVRLHKGYVTTCDKESPHYRLQAKEIKIYLDDRIVAKHIVFYIGKVPVLYLPIYVHRLDAKRPQVTVIAGKDKQWGYYVLSAWRYFFDEGCRGDVRLDYREKKGLAEGIDHYYKTKELGSGSAKVYYMKENDITAYNKSGSPENRWRAQWRHRWNMGNNTVNIVEFNKLSDEHFIKDYLYKEYEEEGDPDNFISSITTHPDYTMSVLMRKRMDPFYTVVERLPEGTIDIKNKRIGKTNFYYKGMLSGVYLNKTLKDNIGKDINIMRLDSYNQLSYVTKIGFLHTTPYAGWREGYFSRNRWGDTNVLRDIFSTGVRNSTKFYKVFDIVTEFWGIEINKLRHIITPSADYYYVHQPTVSPDNLHQFDAIDALEAENGIKLSIENKLQTKVAQGESASTVDLATLIVSSDYMFRLKKKALRYKSQKFKDVGFQLELQPYPWLFILSKMVVNTKDQTVESTSIDFTASQGKDWSLGLGHRYESAGDTDTNLLTSDLFYQLGPKWAVRIYERLDILNNKIEEQEYTIYRDLHCWVSEVTYSVKGALNNPVDQTVWVVFRVKAFPDLPIGFRRSYSGPRPGANRRE